MSEEKMQTDQAFLAAVVSLKEVKRRDDPDGDFLMRLYYHIWKAALKFVNTNSESEAGAVGYIDEEGIFISVKAYNKVINVFKCLYTPVFLAPPSAQAIETAAIMKCAEVADAQYQRDKPLQEAGGQDNSDGYVTGYVDGCGDCGHAIRAIIPQDGRTQLEDACLAALRDFILLYEIDMSESPDPEYELRSIIKRAISGGE